VAKFRNYAQGLMRQYDKNKNGVLDRDEAAELQGPLREARRNADGAITLEALTEKVLEVNHVSGSSSQAGDSATQAGKKSYRFISAQERLPKGLPDWFYQKDLNGDGQVTMAEYSSTWSDATAGEFSKWDLNNDGVITPDEVLKVLGGEKKIGGEKKK
jgi:hypothetical protein